MGAPLTLASTSPRRKELLERLGFQVRVVQSGVDETQLPGELPEDFAKRMARAKVAAAVKRLQATLYTTEQEARRSVAQGTVRSDDAMRWVVGADTVVVLDDVTFGKPADLQDARDMLMRLSGREHLVMTAFCVFDLKRNREGLQAVTTVVKFKQLTAGEIDQYLSVGESLDKAGSYAVQGVGSYMVEYLHGSYTNVVGLPLCQVVEMMEEMGARDVLPWGQLGDPIARKDFA